MKNLYILGFASLLVGFFPQSALSQNIKLDKGSPLNSYMEEYLTPEADDPLKTPEMKAHSSEAAKLGWEHFERKDFETALRRFFMSIRMDSKNAEGYFGVGYVCCIQGDLKDAMIFYREAIKCNDKCTPAYANLANALMITTNGQSPEIVPLLDKAIASDPKFPESYYDYACYYAHKNKWKEAGEMTNKAIALKLKPHAAFIKELQKHGVVINGM